MYPQSPMDKLRVAHISDLHFAKVSFSPLQFFSKRWIGNLNLIVSRKHALAPQRLLPLVSLFHEIKVDLVVVTGDLSTTSLNKEFLKAKEFLDQMQSLQIKVISIPGNHDHYTQGAWKKKRFYDYFPDIQGNDLSLRNDGLAAIDLNASWTMIALDTALATSLTSSRGSFTQSHEDKLLKVLRRIPTSKNILMINHFPLFQHERNSKTLERAPALKALLRQFPNVRFYLHGHTHKHCVADLRSNGLPIILDSGSTADLQRGSWNLLDLMPHHAKVQAFCNHGTPQSTWRPFRQLTWSFL
ncbi:MAG: metallophosphoesterase [Simkania sp.]|nr:metallophosphoesterase [Simkania sp.]